MAATGTVTEDSNSVEVSSQGPMLVLIRGLPRSGKSTWAKAQGVPVVCPDSIRLELYGQAFYADGEPMVWAIVKVILGALFRSGHECVILDACNLNRDRDSEWLRWCESHKVRLGEHIVSTPREVCIQRALDERRFDLLAVIDRMAGYSA